MRRHFRRAGAGGRLLLQTAPSLAGQKARLGGASAQAVGARLSRFRAGRATRWRCALPVTTPRVHRQYAPEGQEARAVYEAMEQARCESIGARRDVGSGRQPFRHARRALRARRLCRRDRALRGAAGRCAGADRARKAHRPDAAPLRRSPWWICGAAGSRIAARMRSTACSRASTARRISPPASRSLLAALDLAEDIGEENEDLDEDQQPEGGEDQSSENSSGESEEMEGEDTAEAQESEMPGSEEEMGESEAGDTYADAFPGPERAMRRPRMPARRSVPTSLSATSRTPITRSSPTRFDEVVLAEDLCETAELDRLRAFLDKQLVNLQGAVSRLANRLQRRLMGAAEPVLGFRSGKRALARPRPACRGSLSIRCSRSPSSRRRTPTSATPSSRCSLDNSGSMRGASDHGCGGVCRHSRPHAGALRREGGDPRPSPRARGRAASRARRGSAPTSR